MIAVVDTGVHQSDSLSSKAEVLLPPSVKCLPLVTHSWVWELPWKWLYTKLSNEMNVLVDEFCPTLCDPTDCSLPGSSVHVILEVRILEWVAILFPRGSFQPKDQTVVSRIPGRFFTIPEPPGKTFLKVISHIKWWVWLQRSGPLFSIRKQNWIK